MRTALALLAAGALLAGAPPAMAEPDRAGARQLAAAVKQFRSGIVAQRDELHSLAARRELPVCLVAIRNVPLEPDPANAAARAYVGAYTQQAFALPIRDAAARFAEDLASSRVQDRKLRRGRDALLEDAIGLTRFNAPPADLCERLDAWRAAGYPADAAPTIEDPAVDAALADSTSRARKDRAIDRSGKRLRKLGVKRRVVSLWSGTGLLAGINLGDDELPYGDAHVPPGPATASLAAASRRGDRADARALARATKWARKAVLSHREASRPAAEAVEDPRCQAVLDAVPAGSTEAAFGIVFGYAFTAALHPARAELARFERRLYAVKLRDRVLISGRAAWRKELRAAQKMTPAPLDICARLESWAQAGYPPEQASAVLANPGVEELLALPDGLEDRIGKAGDRLRELGVKPSTARLWGGIGMLFSG